MTLFYDSPDEGYKLKCIGSNYEVVQYTTGYSSFYVLMRFPSSTHLGRNTSTAIFRSTGASDLHLNMFNNWMDPNRLALSSSDTRWVV